MSLRLDTMLDTMHMKLRYTADNNGTMYYQRRYPTALAAAFTTRMYRRSLKLPANTPYADALPAWTRAEEEYKLLLELASNSSADVITGAELDRKAAVYLRTQGLDVGEFADQKEPWHDADRAIDISDIENHSHPEWTGELTPADDIRGRANMLLQIPRQRTQHYLSDCWDVYAREKGLVDSQNTRMTHSRWNKWLALCGEAKLLKRDEATEEHIEAGLDKWVQQKQAKGVRGSTISREISTVLAVVRLCIKHWRLGLNITAPTIKGGTKYDQRIPLNEQQQKAILAVALEEGGANGVALMLMLTTGMISSEIQRLPLANVHLDGPVPYLLIDGDTKTEARKRPVPIVVELEWLRDQIQQLQQRSVYDGEKPMALGRRYCALKNPSAKLTARVRKLVPETSAYGLRHSFRLNATTHNANGVNAALLGGWTTGHNGIMLNYGKAGLENPEALRGLAVTARTINKHLLKPAKPRHTVSALTS